jgi:hypothetical protein
MPHAKSSIEYTRTLSSFSGADIIVTFGRAAIGELQQITWAVTREKVPIYTMGNADPRSVSRGKRGIAGSLIFAVFDRDALIAELVENRENWQAIAPPAMFTAAPNIIARTSDYTNAMEMAEWSRKATEAQTPEEPVLGSDLESRVYPPSGFGVIMPEHILYADMLPPFDILMTFANEYGQTAFQKIYGVELLNEGSGANVDTIVMERQLTFIARRVSPMITGVYRGKDLVGTPVVAPSR